MIYFLCIRNRNAEEREAFDLELFTPPPGVSRAEDEEWLRESEMAAFNRLKSKNG